MICRRSFPPSRLPVISIFLLSCAGAGGDARDVVPESHDVVVDAGARARSAEAYEYVARRPLAVVALAEARGIAPDVARAAIEHLADAVDTCVTEEGRKGALLEGAARVIAQVDTSGNVAGVSLRVDPSAGKARDAVLCLVAPTKLLTFPPTDAGVRGLAVEALWGRALPAPDAG
jgi:hypothetical protein